MGGLTPEVEIAQREVRGDPGLTYFQCTPPGAGLGAPLFVSVHGHSRNAARNAELFAPLTADVGAVLVAPLFPLERFPDYHCLGRQGRGDRSDRAVDRICAEVAADTGARADRLYLFGYSGGAQFAHRYMMAHPERVAGIAIAAAGWYTFPDETRAYPLGVRPTEDLPDVVMDPQRFLLVSCLVLVGEGDVVRDPHMLQEQEVDAQQGLHRVERAERWVAAMTAAAEARGLPTAYRREMLPGAGHSFVDCMTLADMGSRVFTHLFGLRLARV